MLNREHDVALEPFSIIMEDDYLILPSEEKLPCGCGRLLVYQPLQYTTYTPEGIEVTVENLMGYKCNNCGLVALLPEVNTELYKRIDDVRQGRNLL
jgi:hypothetical protein